MRPLRGCSVAAALFILGLAGVAGAQQAARQPPPVIPWGGPPFTWWRDAGFQSQLGLTADQSNRIDAAFQSALPQLRQKRNELDAQESELSRLVETDADEATILRQSKYVESIRAELNTGRLLMLWHMRQILTADQRAKMQMLSDQWNQEHPGPRGGGNRNQPARRRN